MNKNINLTTEMIEAFQKLQSLFETKQDNFLGVLKFNNKEISKMPEKIRRFFKAQGFAVSYRKRVRGKKSCDYEARFRRGGYNISVSATNLVELKKRFLERLKKCEEVPAETKIPTTFNAFSMHYFEHLRKRKVSEQTFKNDMNRFKKHLLPAFGEIPLKEINFIQLQKFIESKGRTKTADELFSLLNGIFKAAIKPFHVLDDNPMDYVIHEVRRPCEKSHGKALTKEEEILLLSTFKGTRFETMFAIALYCGLRPNEYSTARLSDDGKFIIAVNSKRKSKANVEYKKIPVTPMLRGYINENMDIQVFSGEYIRKIFHKLFKDKHILYDLRTTFYTRLRECGVSDAARNEFVGHSEKALEQTYTDLSDEYLLKEGEKFKY